MHINLPTSTSSLDEAQSPELKALPRSSSPPYFNQTPLFYLRKPHRLLTHIAPGDNRFKRLSQTNLRSLHNFSEEKNPDATVQTRKFLPKTPMFFELTENILKGPFAGLASSPKFQIPGKKSPEANTETAVSPKNKRPAGLIAPRRLGGSQLKTGDRSSKDSSPLTPKSPITPQMIGQKSPPRQLTRNKSRTVESSKNVERLRSLFRKSKTVRLPANERLYYNDSGNPMLSSVIRRKSCHCSDCGGMSAFEKKHLNVSIALIRGYRSKEEPELGYKASRFLKSPSHRFDSVSKRSIQEDDFFFERESNTPKDSARSSVNGNPPKVVAQAPSKFHAGDGREGNKKVSIIKKKMMKIEKKNSNRKRASPSPKGKKVPENMQVNSREKIATLYKLSAREEIQSMVGSPKKNLNESGALSARDSHVDKKGMDYESRGQLNTLRVSTNSNQSIDLKQKVEEESEKSMSAKSKALTSGNLKVISREKSQEFLPKINTPSTLMSFYSIMRLPKLKNTAPKTQTPLREKGIRSTYKINEHSSISLQKIIDGALSSHLKSKPMDLSVQSSDSTEYMIPNNYASREVSNEKGKCINREKSDDPYNMVSSVFQPQLETDTKMKRRIEKDKDGKTEENSPRPLASLRLKLGNLLVTASSTERVPKLKVSGAFTERSITSSEESPWATVGVNKLMKAYEPMENRSSVGKQRIKQE